MRLKFSILYFVTGAFGIVQWCNQSEPEHWHHELVENKSLQEIRAYVASLLLKDYEVDVTVTL